MDETLRCVERCINVVQSPSKSTNNRDQAINIRANRNQRDLIDQAAQSLGKSRSDFMLETAYREATNVLLDRTYFPLGEAEFDRFLELIESPPPPSAELRRLLGTSAPWE